MVLWFLSDVQFGFKENLFCAHALFTLQEVLHYLNKQHMVNAMLLLDGIG